MLRNFRLFFSVRRGFLLNEVLSLNAQELQSNTEQIQTLKVLNEVLSLNAQESVAVSV